MLVLQVTAATSGGAAAQTRPATERQRPVSLEARLELKLDAARGHRRTIRHFQNHRARLSSGEHRADARNGLRRARRALAKVTKEAAYYRRLIRVSEARRLAKAPPKVAIRAVFGRYAKQALAVSWCESRFRTRAQNGQYLGLFQMGSSARRLFGHGQTAHRQALAAHKYFVLSGRDWSPWSCRWAAS